MSGAVGGGGGVALHQIIDAVAVPGEQVLGQHEAVLGGARGELRHAQGFQHPGVPDVDEAGADATKCTNDENELVLIIQDK